MEPVAADTRADQERDPAVVLPVGPPGASGEQLENRNRTQVLTLPYVTRLLSGHGPETTVGEEKRNNPFVGGM